jgi:hypothetical protein
MPDTFSAFREKWQHTMNDHVLPWPDVLAMLGSAGFSTVEQQSMPYLFRWELYESVRPLEEHLIATGRIKEVGIRWTGRRS